MLLIVVIILKLDWFGFLCFLLGSWLVINACCSIFVMLIRELLLCELFSHKLVDHLNRFLVFLLNSEPVSLACFNSFCDFFRWQNQNLFQTILKCKSWYLQLFSMDLRMVCLPKSLQNCLDYCVRSVLILRSKMTWGWGTYVEPNLLIYFSYLHLI